MTEENQDLSFSELVSKLRQLCQEHCTGLVMIRPGGSYVARINLVNGEIVAVVFKGKSGAEALPQLATIDSGQLHFIEGQLTTATLLPLPSTEDILADLATQTQAKATGTTDNGSRHEDVSEVKTVLETALSEYIGPMASLVCESQWEEGQELEIIIKALAAKIPQPHNRKQFIQEVSAQLSLSTSENG